MPARHRKCLLLCFAISLLFLSFILFHDSSLTFQRASVTSEFRAGYFKSVSPLLRDRELNSTKTYKILAWTGFFGKSFNYPPVIKTFYNNTCTTTNEKSEVTSADALIFHLVDVMQMKMFGGGQPNSLPTFRHKDQIWVLVNMEPIPNIYGDLQKLNGLFNATAMFVKESDFYSPYGSYGRLRSTDMTEEVDYFQANYKKGGVAMISNCVTDSNRLRIISKLRSFIPIRLLGKCGKRCGNYSACYEEVKHYKFYFALENNECRDYVSEKYWRPIQNGQLPVVAWRYSMKDVVIPNSYINLYDFPDHKKAGKYLQEVANNRTLYNSYFRWKREYSMDAAVPREELCDRLHSPNRTYTIYHDMKGWLTNNSCEQMTASREFKAHVREILHWTGLPI